MLSCYYALAFESTTLHFIFFRRCHAAMLLRFSIIFAVFACLPIDEGRHFFDIFHFIFADAAAIFSCRCLC